MNHQLRKLSLLAVLGLGSLMGLPMTSEEIEELLSVMNQPKVELVVEKEHDEE